MKENGACPKCHGSEIIGNVPILDRDEYGDKELTARIDRTPAALLFRNVEDFPFRAFVCSNCGFTEFYLEHARQFSKTWKALHPA